MEPMIKKNVIEDKVTPEFSKQADYDDFEEYAVGLFRPKKVVDISTSPDDTLEDDNVSE